MGKYDLIVIGSGPAGQRAAIQGSKAGKNVAVAEKREVVGGACINETLLHIAQEELPFGGVGPSGMGHYHGKWGFDSMSKLTPVFRQSKLNGMGLFMPPYRPIVHRMLALMKKM